MSKSDSNENSYVLITDSPDVIRRKFKRSVTDSIGVVNYTDEQPGVKFNKYLLENFKYKSLKK